jgi:NAD(P)-dependent dehydrogenase (short-subunit alcohol dehydrogenase family)
MSDQAALVTGASRGIGRAIAVALAEQGWSIAINYRGNAEAAAETRSLVENAGGRGVAIQADIADANDRGRLVEQTLASFNRIDLLVNNAGMAPRQRADLLETSEASYDEVMAVNLKGPFFLTQRVAKVMIDLLKAGVIEHPKIVNIGSMSAYTTSVNRAEYCLSKAGLGMMTALYADRLSEYGIHVYELRPGIIETDMTSIVQAKYDRLIAEGLTPIRRWGQPDDVARAVIAIAQDQFLFSTGEVINVDGGFHLRRL